VTPTTIAPILDARDTAAEALDAAGLPRFASALRVLPVPSAGGVWAWLWSIDLGKAREAAERRLSRMPNSDEDRRRLDEAIIACRAVVDMVRIAAGWERRERAVA